jgi:predicted site-specific integrase-resolvase
MEIRDTKLYKLPEVALILSVSEQTVTKKIKEGRIRAIPHKQFEHYKVFGKDIKDYLGI